MSGAAHPQSSVRQQIMRDDRRARKIALACVASIAALLVALVLALAGDRPAQAGPRRRRCSSRRSRGRDLRVARHPLRRRAGGRHSWSGPRGLDGHIPAALRRRAG